MVGAAMGLASRGAIAFPSTFACFLTRAYDFIRMAAISRLNVKLAGSHAGVSIGEDGPSQMALEDLAMMRAAAEHRRALPVRRRQHRAAGGRGRLPRGPGLHPHLAAEDAGHLRTRRAVPGRRLQGAPPEPAGRGDGRRRGRDGVRGAEGLRRAEEGGRRHPRDRPLLDPADRRGDAEAGGRRDGRADRDRRGSLRGRRPRRRRRGRHDAAWPPFRSSPSATSRAAASPRNCWTGSASRPATSSRPCGR